MMFVTGITLIICGCASQNAKLIAVHIESSPHNSLKIEDVKTYVTPDGKLHVSGVIVKRPGRPSPRNYGVEILVFNEQGQLLTNATTTYFPSQIANNRPEAESRADFFANLAVNPELVKTVCILSPPQDRH